MLGYFHLAACCLLTDAELGARVHLLGEGVRLPPAVLLAGVLAPVHSAVNNESAKLYNLGEGPYYYFSWLKAPTRALTF